MVDLSFLDQVEDSQQIKVEDKQMLEIEQLVDLARYVGSYTWQYKNDDKYHDGIIAQELLQVPGLKDAVYKKEDGHLEVDIQYLAMAAIGYIAALTRLIIKMPPVTSTPEDVEEQQAVEADKVPGEMDTGSEAVEETIANGEMNNGPDTVNE